MSFCRGVPKCVGRYRHGLDCLAQRLRLRPNLALPSWNDGASKQAIISFVKQVTDKSEERLETDFRFREVAPKSSVKIWAGG